jgi:hypothetical protein
MINIKVFRNRDVFASRDGLKTATTRTERKLSDRQNFQFIRPGKKGNTKPEPEVYECMGVLELTFKEAVDLGVWRLENFDSAGDYVFTLLIFYPNLTLNSFVWVHLYRRKEAAL